MNFRKNILSLFIVLLSSSYFAQLERKGAKNLIDDNEKKQGKWEVKYENSKIIRYSGQFLDDNPIGQFIYYYPSGEVSTLIKFQQINTSYAQLYYKNRNLMAHGNFVNKKKDSVWWYFNENKEVISKEYYENGLLSGDVYTYYPRSELLENKLKIMEVQHYDKGLKDGSFKQYFENSKIKTLGNYNEGKLHGKSQYFTQTGSLSMQGNFNKGLKTGYWLFYSDSAKPDKKVYFLEGKVLEGKELEKHLEKIKNK
jgi:antitoxin component YwqK of YwqJK toxin-antitoxin module